MVDITSIAGKKGNSIVNTVIGILLIIAIIVILTKVYKAMNTGSKLIGEQIGDQTLSVQTGVPAARIAYIRGKGQELWDKGVTDWWLTYNYDEDMFIQAINDMSNTGELSLLNSFFKGIHSKGVSVKGVVSEAFNSSDIARLKAGYYQYLMST